MIQYKAGFKYQLCERYTVSTGIIPEKRIVTDYIRLELDGCMNIESGYAWDGPSGPALDTKNFMRASLVHDAGYQLMRMRELDQNRRSAVDAEMRKICLEDGMTKIRAWWTWRAVTRLAGGAAAPRARKPILLAP